jgi:MFS family permease
VKNEKSVFFEALRYPALWVGALGYFVDLYDLVLFGAVRVASLKSLGVPESELLSTGAFLLNAQMGGLLLGGFVWGVLGDKKGRLTVLYGSILLYSVAYLFNATVTSVSAYGFWRFLGGFGLAGELGGAVTLMAEILPKRARGYGSTIIGLAGFLGALLAATVAQVIPWRWAYASGGALGLLLLVVRLRSRESDLFARAKESQQKKGDLWQLLAQPRLRLRFLKSLVIGLPIWLISGVLIYFAPELASEMGILQPVSAAQAIFWSYAGTIFGDVLSGFVSQQLKSRKKLIAICLSLLTLAILIYCFGLRGVSSSVFYATCFFMGLGTGYWALFVLTTAEQFGTNLRATVATSAPNIVRGAAIPLVALFRWGSPLFGATNSAFVLGLACLTIAGFSLYYLPETYDSELDFLEPH